MSLGTYKQQAAGLRRRRDRCIRIARDLSGSAKRYPKGSANRTHLCMRATLFARDARVYNRRAWQMVRDFAW